MAAGVIRNLPEFRLPASFQHSFLHPTPPQDMDFQDLSDEEEVEEEDDYDVEEEDSPPCHSPGREGQNVTAGCSQSDAEVTLQLLKFSELISCDIQRYFGRKAKDEDPDSCNIYEDGFTPRRLGRELYYADLMRLAQSGELDDEDAQGPAVPPGQLDQRVWRSICNKDGVQKLGPLAELFEYGLHRFLKRRVADGRKLRLEKKYAHIMPMHKRKLPQSFWKEPSPSPPCILNTNPPDFSDLLANWTSESGQEQELPSTSRELARPAMETDQFSVL
ncbi:protein PERCC1 [Dermochelys coriacea]|uniref:protein PERCC1 n=1 Tax=Dermochelys coriacea TaxID=27794 RepID=UPI0018E76EF2|nr:protein PERCC1 [Dermochelys coriacea]